MVGNDSAQGGKQPIGLIADFRIYAKVLSETEIEEMVHGGVDKHPDHIVRELARRNATQILARRLDVPDSAAECLRCLGNLATLATERAKIFGTCGREILRLLESPLPMLQRQAARLTQNLH